MANTWMGDLPPDLQADALALQRRNALAETMLRNTPLWNKNRKIEQLYTQNRDAMQGVANQYDTGLRNAISEWMALRQGRPAEVIEGGFDQTPAVQPNMNAATLKALSSGYGPLQRLGAMDLKAQSLDLGELLKNDSFDPKTKVLAAQMLAQGMPATQVLAQLKGKPQIIQHQGDVGSVQDGTVSTIGQLGSEAIPPNWADFLAPGVERGPTPGTYFQPSEAGKDLMQLTFAGGKHTGSKKLDNAPKVNTTIQNTPPRHGANKAFDLAAGTVNDLGERARAAQDMMHSLSIMQNNDQQGMFSNTTTGLASFMTNLAQAANLPLSQKQLSMLGNTETFNSVATEVWQKLISQMGGNRGVTQQEAEQIKQILPQTRHSPQARQELYKILTMIANKNITRYRVANAAYWRAISADKPEIWGEHLGETLLPQTPNMPAAAPNSPEAFGGRPVRR